MPVATSTGSRWLTRPETAADHDAVRALTLAAFDGPDEADLVDALRADPAWIDGLSLVSTTTQGLVVGHALLTRCSIGSVPALCLAPCSVAPAHQRTGAGSAAIEAALAAARHQGESLVVVLGHPAYYPRFGFERASASGISLSVEVPDEALMAMTLDPARPLPPGRVRYASPFGIEPSVDRDVPRMVLMCGLAGSGKTTYAHELEARGHVRFTIDGEAWARGFTEAAAIPAEVAADIRERQREEIALALDAGEDVVVDYSFHSRAQRDDYRALGRAHGAGVEVVFLDTPETVARRRLAQRRGAGPDDFVVDEVLLDAYVAGFEVPGADEDDVTVITTGG